MKKTTAFIRAIAFVLSIVMVLGGVISISASEINVAPIITPEGSGDVIVMPTIEPKTYKVVFSENEGGTLVLEKEDYEAGESIEFEIIAYEGFEIAGVSAYETNDITSEAIDIFNDKSIKIKDNYFVMPESDVRVVIDFVEKYEDYESTTPIVTPGGNTTPIVDTSEVVDIDDIDGIDYEPLSAEETFFNQILRSIAIFANDVISLISRPHSNKLVTVDGQTKKLSDTTTQFQIEESQELWDRTDSPNAIEATSKYNISTKKLTDPMPTGYEFGPRYRTGISKAESFGGMNTEDAIGYYVTYAGAEPNSEVGKDSRAMRINAGDASKKGTFGMLYKNVGTYKGRVIDCKLTIMDYEFLRFGGAVSNGLVLLRGDRMGTSIFGLAWVDVKYDYLDSATGNPVNVKAYITINDLDAVQSMGIFKNRTNITGYYVPEASNLRVEQDEYLLYWRADSVWQNDRSSRATAAILQDSFSFTFEGNSQQQRFCYGFYSRQSHGKNNVKYKQGFVAKYPTSWKRADLAAMETDINVEINGKLKLETFGWPSVAFFSYIGASISRSVVSPLEKYVADTDESISSPTRSDFTKNTLNSISEEYTYHLYHSVPTEANENWYDTYVVSDTLADCLEVVSVKAYNYAHADVTSLFTIATAGQKVTITAKNVRVASFYGQDYRFEIKAKIKEGYDLKPWTVSSSDGKKVYQIKNVGKVNITRGGTPEEHTSNETMTTVTVFASKAQVIIEKTDDKSGANLANAEFTLYQWSIAANKYVEKEKLTYNPDLELYRSTLISATTDNLGKYKVVETKTPTDYTGTWEKEFVVTDEGQTFTYNVTNTPNGETTLTKKSVVISDGERGEETGMTLKPTIVSKGDIIEYNLYVKRSGASGYKSGKLTITDEIPADAIYSTETLNIKGEITNAVNDSTAKVEKMTLEEGIVTWTVINLDKDEMAHLSFEVTAPDKGVVLKNEALLKDPQDSGEVPSNPVEHEVYLPELSIVKGSDPIHESEVESGDIITYTINVSNAGRGDAKGVVISDIIPNGTTYVVESIKCEYEGTVINYDEVTDTVSATIPVIKAGESVVFEFAVMVDESDEAKTIRNMATLKEPNEPEVPSNEVSHPQNKLISAKSSDPATNMVIHGEDIITYFIKVTNGTEVDAKNVIVRDMVPEHTTYVANSMETAVTGAKMELIKIAGKAYVTYVLPEVEANSSVVVSFKVKVDTIDVPTDIINKAQVKEPDKDTPPEVAITIPDGYKDTNETIHYMNQVSIAKSSDPKSGSKVKKDEIITYKLTVTNGSKHDAKNIIVRDGIPEHTSYVKKSATVPKNVKVKTIDIDGKEYLVWVIEEVKVGETIELTFKAKVTADKANTVVKNMAQVKESKTDKPFDEAKENEGFKDSNEVTHTLEKPSKVTSDTSDEPKTSMRQSPAPKTGDRMPVMLWLSLGGAALLSIIGTLVYKKNKRSKITNK